MLAFLPSKAGLCMAVIEFRTENRIQCKLWNVLYVYMCVDGYACGIMDCAKAEANLSNTCKTYINCIQIIFHIIYYLRLRNCSSVFSHICLHIYLTTLEMTLLLLHVTLSPCEDLCVHLSLLGVWANTCKLAAKLAPRLNLDRFWTQAQLLNLLCAPILPKLKKS